MEWIVKWIGLRAFFWSPILVRMSDTDPKTISPAMTIHTIVIFFIKASFHPTYYAVVLHIIQISHKNKLEKQFVQMKTGHRPVFKNLNHLPSRFNPSNPRHHPHRQYDIQRWISYFRSPEIWRTSSSTEILISSFLISEARFWLGIPFHPPWCQPTDPIQQS